MCYVNVGIDLISKSNNTEHLHACEWYMCQILWKRIEKYMKIKTKPKLISFAKEIQQQ